MADEPARLPDIIIDHIYSEELDRWYRDVFTREHVTDDERDAIEEAVSDVYHQRATLDRFVTRVQEAAGNVDRGKMIALEILGNDFLKIEDYLGVDIPAYIKHLGGDPSLFVKEIPVMEVVRGVLAGIGTAPTDPVIAKRLETSITAYLSGIRDALETKDVLMRSVKVGGIGLDAATAARITSALEEKLRALQHAGVILRKGDGKPPEQSTFHLVKPTKTGLMQREDEEEIDRLRASAPVDTMREQLRTAVDRIVQKTGAKFKSDDVSRRFRGAVEARLRDIRDYQETLDLLTRPSTAGGFGITAEQSKKVLSVVEEEVRALHGSAPRMATDRGRMATDGTDTSGQRRGGVHPLPRADVKSAPTAPQHEVSPSPAPTTAITPQLVHPVPPVPPLRVRGGVGELPPGRNPSQPPLAPRGGAAGAPTKPKPEPLPVVTHIPIAPPPSSMSTVTPSTTVEPPKSASLIVPPPAPPPLEQQKSVVPVPAKPQSDSPKLQAPSPAMLVPPPPVVAPSPVVKRIPIAPAPKPQAESSKPVVEAFRPPPDRGDLKVAATPPSVPSAAIRSDQRPSVVLSRPKLQDIRPMPARLVGPIEELAQLTLSDFRKIAKTPAEAAARIAEKLALLEKDSYTKRSEGVKVLRGSPLMGAYADVVNAALIAKRTIEAEVRERFTKDKAAMTLEEVQALMGLNAQLRF